MPNYKLTRPATIPTYHHRCCACNSSYIPSARRLILQRDGVFLLIPACNEHWLTLLTNLKQLHVLAFTLYRAGNPSTIGEQRWGV